MSTPIFSSKAKAVRPPSCTRRRSHSLSFFFAMTVPPPPTPLQVVKMPKEVLRSAITSRCSAAVVADAAAAAPPPASPSKLKAPAGEGGRGVAPDTTAPPPRPPHMPPCNGGTLLRLHLAQLTSAFLQATAPRSFFVCFCVVPYTPSICLQPFQPYLNAVATPGLPLPVLQPFRPSAFMQVMQPKTTQPRCSNDCAGSGR